jgi:hypothetical protein
MTRQFNMTILTAAFLIGAAAASFAAGGGGGGAGGAGGGPGGAGAAAGGGAGTGARLVQRPDQRGPAAGQVIRQARLGRRASPLPLPEPYHPGCPEPFQARPAAHQPIQLPGPDAPVEQRAGCLLLPVREVSAQPRWPQRQILSIPRYE